MGEVISTTTKTEKTSKSLSKFPSNIRILLVIWELRLGIVVPRLVAVQESA